MLKIKVRVFNLAKDKLSIHPSLVSKYEAFNAYKSEFKTEAFSKAFITKAMEVSPVSVVDDVNGGYFCITGQHLLESLYKFKIQKISVILYEDIDDDEIELLYAASLLSSHFFMKDRHVFLAALVEQINLLPTPIRKTLLDQSYSYSSSKIIEKITGESRSAIDHQKSTLQNKQLRKKTPSLNTINFLLSENK